MRRRFFAILEKPEGGGGVQTPPPSRARVKVGTIKILVFPDFSSNLTQFAQVVGALTQGELEEQMKLMAVCREDCTCGGKRDIESKTIGLVFDRRGAWVRV